MRFPGKSEAVEFEYAKAAGLLSKSFTGSRAAKLFEQSSLTDIWELLFNCTPPMVPERLLAEQIERDCHKKLINQYESFLKTSGSKQEVLRGIVKTYEVENIKEIVAALCSNEKECPELYDLGNFNSIHPEFWPDIAKITDKTEYSWLKELPDIHSQHEVDYKLDLQLVQNYWKSIQKLSGENKEAHEKMFLNEYVFKNIVWALRLSVYYDMSEEEIKGKLLYVESVDKSDPLAGPALKILSIPKDDYNAWMNWKYSELVNPYENGQGWKIDPVWVEQKAQILIEKQYNHIFHQYPMTTASLVAWFKIKDFELSCIRTAVESIRLNIASDEAMNAVGVQTI